MNYLMILLILVIIIVIIAVIVINVKNKNDDVKTDGLKDVKSDSKDVKKDGLKDVKSDSKDVEKDKENVKSDSKDAKTDKENVKSDSKDVKSDSKDVKNDSKDVKNDSKDVKTDDPKDVKTDEKEDIEIEDPKDVKTDDPKNVKSDPKEDIENETDDEIEDIENESDDEIDMHELGEIERLIENSELSSLIKEELHDFKYSFKINETNEKQIGDYIMTNATSDLYCIMINFNAYNKRIRNIALTTFSFESTKYAICMVNIIIKLLKDELNYNEIKQSQNSENLNYYVFDIKYPKPDKIYDDYKLLNNCIYAKFLTILICTSNNLKDSNTMLYTIQSCDNSLIREEFSKLSENYKVDEEMTTILAEEEHLNNATFIVSKEELNKTIFFSLIIVDLINEEVKQYEQDKSIYAKQFTNPEKIGNYNKIDINFDSKNWEEVKIKFINNAEPEVLYSDICIYAFSPDAIVYILSSYKVALNQLVDSLHFKDVSYSSIEITLYYENEKHLLNDEKILCNFASSYLYLLRVHVLDDEGLTKSIYSIQTADKSLVEKEYDKLIDNHFNIDRTTTQRMNSRCSPNTVVFKTNENEINKYLNKNKSESFRIGIYNKRNRYLYK